MLSKTLDAAAKNIGFTVTPDNAYGIYGGYLITIYETGNKKTAFINFLLEDDPDDNSDTSLSAFNISEAIKENLDNYAIIDYNLADDGLTVTTTGSAPDLFKLIDFCVELLNEHSTDEQKIKGSDFCSCCGKSFGKRYPKKLTRGNKNYLLCESCALEVLEEQDKKTSQISEKIPLSKRLLGILGAVIGGLIGIFCFFAFSKWLLPHIQTWDSFIYNFLFALIGFLTSYLVYIGYRVFCRKASLTAYISVPIISILFSVFGIYMGTIVKILTDHDNINFNVVYKTVCMMPLRTLEGATTNYSSPFYLYGGITFFLAAAGAVIFLLGFYEKNRIVSENIKVETLKIENK